ncbi:MAG: hypothetical protein H0V11_06475 [Actinobacteria bacterium]|nr:hypothetical protein [Actinomycetota bacterium]
MRKVLIDSMAVAGLATVALFIARALAPGRRELELDIYALTLGGLAVLCAVTWLRRALPPAGDSALQRALERPRPARGQLPELARLERELYIGAAQSFDLHYRVRPLLREIALARLAEGGLRLDSGGDAVRESLGDELWELVRPDREPPLDRHGGGIGFGGIERVVARLEGLSR